MVLGIDSCRWAERRLPLLAGGELLGLDRRRVERHVLACAGCRARLDALRRATAALRDAGRVEPAAAGIGAGAGVGPDAPSLWPALARQIRESRHARRPWSRRSLARFAAGLAAGLLLAAGSLGVWIASQHWSIDVQVTVTPRPRHPLRIASAPPAAPAAESEPAAPAPEPPRVVNRDRDRARDRTADLDDRQASVPTN
jgi:hypothetical protein